MNVREARCLFSRFLVDLLQWANTQEMHYALDEGMQHQNKGHMIGSLHYLGCAQDILLYDDNGTYLIETDNYRALG